MTSLNNLSPEEKRVRLAQLLRERAATPREHPLSYGQAALLHLHAQSPVSASYNTMWSATLGGTLDLECLRQAFRAVVERHSALRTTFHWRDGQPFQLVQPAGDVQLEVVDAHGWSSEMIDAQVASAAARPFDLERGPIARLAVFSTGPDHHVLLCSAHHIAVDYWSLVLLMDELRQLYDDVRRGRTPSLPPVRRQYVDHARWQREFLASADGSRLAERWQHKLQGVLPVLTLPTDRPRPAVQGFGGDSYRFAIDQALLDRLRALASARGTTLYTVCLAAFQVLLHRYTGQTDIIVGSPMAGRTSIGSEDVIGYFANTIALRVQCADNPCFTDFLAHVSETVLDALEGQDYPFPLLVERLKLRRDPSRAPVCDVLFSWDKPHYRERGASTASSGDAPGLKFELRKIGQLGATHDLAMIAFERADGLEIAIQHSTDLFDSATMARMARCFTTLLDGIVAEPAQRIGHLPLLPEVERRRVLIDWNATAADYPRDRTVDALFEEQARTSPDAVALMLGSRRMSYVELNRRANQIAHWLRRRGVGPGVMVGVSARRSLETVAMLLGILKAGGAYVPLDLAYPVERLAFMIDDLQLRLVLSEPAFAASLPGSAAEVIVVGGSSDLFAAEETRDLEHRTGPESLAYVMFTSGSTGRPKGVGIPHRGIVRLVKNTNYLSFGPAQVLLHAAAISFDAATFEVWGALLNGGRVAMLEAETPSLDEIGAAIRGHGVTAMFLTSGLFHLMVDHRLDDLRGLHDIFTGGDVVSVPHFERALGALTGCRLFNIYGPTENTTFSTFYRVVQPPVPGTSIPIGRPIANTKIYILDPHLQPVPVGVAGDLYTGGDGVGLGYINRPELTAERFVPDPFAGDPAARMYRTGDLVRYLADGSIEFLGRQDQQVKVRGFRVELPEIEHALRRHPNVGDCVVVVLTGADGDKRLAAYATPRQKPSPTASDLRSHLQATLPEYMVPSLFTVLDQLPLSPTGKLDRGALPAPEAAHAPAAPASGPRTETERRLVVLWQSLLGVDHVGIHDDFFLLGGHSLLGTRLVSRLRDEFEVPVALRSLFDTPTVAALAEIVDRHRANAASAQRAEVLAALDELSEDEIELELTRRLAAGELS